MTVTAQVIQFPRSERMNTAPADTPMHRQLFVEMSEAQQEVWLNGIRERRLRTVQVYEELQAAKRSAKSAKTRAQLQAQCNMMDKELLALTKALEKVEARANKVSALRILLEAESVGSVVDAQEESEDEPT